MSDYINEIAFRNAVRIYQGFEIKRCPFGNISTSLIFYTKKYVPIVIIHNENIFILLNIFEALL